MLQPSLVPALWTRPSSGASALVSVSSTQIRAIELWSMGVALSWWPVFCSCLVAYYLLCLLACNADSLRACRWDSECCENEKWKASADVSSLELGEKQPFYHVLVDSRDWPADSSDVPVAYVAHEKLYAPEVRCPVYAKHV